MPDRYALKNQAKFPAFVAADQTVDGNWSFSAHLILAQDDDPVTPTLAFGDGDTGFYEIADDNLRIAIGGATKWRYLVNNFEGLASGAPAIINIDSTETVPTLCPDRADLDTGIGRRGADLGTLIAGGVNVLEFGEGSAAPRLGFFGTVSVAQPTGVAVTAAAIHAALVTLGLITA
jgi:hypothetical protein